MLDVRQKDEIKESDLTAQEDNTGKTMYFSTILLTWINLNTSMDKWLHPL